MMSLSLNLKLFILSAALVLISLAAIFLSASATTDGNSVNGSLKHNGKERTYALFIPEKDALPRKRPLVLVLHESGGNSKSMLKLTQGQFNKLALRKGFLVAYPDGMKRNWNEGRQAPISFAHKNGIDDVGFLRALIESLQEQFLIDEERIFIAGMSNGGMMAMRMACEMPDLIRAVAAVTASLPVDVAPMCHGMNRTSLLLMNGTNDPILPYEGGAIVNNGREEGEVMSTEATVAHWLRMNGCPSHAETDLLPDLYPEDRTTVTRFMYAGCPEDVAVLLYRIEGGGHTWPGGRQHVRSDRIGRTSQDINACERIWAFFNQFD